MTTEPNRQHGNHQAVGISAYEAFTKAADPSYHPEQLSESVGVWQVRKLYVLLRSRDSSLAKTGSVVEIDASARTAEGPSIGELSLSALQRHRSQGLDKLTRGKRELTDRKSTRLNSSHTVISYAVFCLKKKK